MSGCCESNLILSFNYFQGGVLSVPCSSLGGQGLGSPASWCTLCMRHTSYPTSHQLALCPHLLLSLFSTPYSPSLCPKAPCVCQPALCLGLEVPWQEGGCSLHSCYGVWDFQCPRVFWIGADLPLPIPICLGIRQWQTALRHAAVLRQSFMKDSHVPFLS